LALVFAAVEENFQRGWLALGGEFKIESEAKKERRDFIAQKPCDGAAILSAQADHFTGVK
jgi:hypothetical protein